MEFPQSAIRNPQSTFTGLFSHVYAHWPVYLFGFGGGAAVILVIALVSAARGWWSFILLGLAALLVLVYFLAALLWAAHQQYDVIDVHGALFEMGRLEADDRFVHIDLGRRLPAQDLARRLTTGRLVVVDLYNPQLTPSASLKRWRSRTVHPPADPRLLWRDGSLELLPFPDGSVTAVTMVYTASYFWQHGDRMRLLEEIFRVLKPGGRLLMAERVRSQTHLMVLGPGVLRLHTADYWRSIMRQVGYLPREEQTLQGLVHCFCAEKPVPVAGRQLPLNF